MTIVQDFSFHTHNNAFGIYDGKSSCDEMISKAEEIGFSAIGVSNHLIWHPDMRKSHRMFFSDYKQALDTYKQTVNQIREVGSRHKIKVYAGFEVDFFPSSVWRNHFEEILKEVDVDYLIGSTHFIRSQDEKYLYNIYHLDELPQGTPPEIFDEYLRNYWLNIVACINSGYFDFIAHIDYCTIFNLSVGSEWDEYKWMVIEALAKNNQAYELNTSGYDRIGNPHPAPWMIKELQKRNVPIVISDDAHSTDKLGQHFIEAENLLSELNYTNRWKLQK